MAEDRIGSGSVWGRWNNSATLTAHPGAMRCLWALAAAARQFLERKGQRADKKGGEPFARYLVRCPRLNKARHSPTNLFRKYV